MKLALKLVSRPDKPSRSVRSLLPALARFVSSPLANLNATTANRSTIAVAGLLVAGLSTAAAAESLKPIQAGSFKLNDWTASVYYTDSGGSYEVVATLAALHGSDRVPIRFITALAPGQSTQIKIGSFDASEEPAVLEIERDEAELSTTLVPDASVISAPASQ